MPLIGNKVVEKDLRDYLSKLGYYGRTAQFSNLKLVAVQRPGWLQVFSFDVRAKHESAGWTDLHGACLDDERYKRFEVVLDEAAELRDVTISEWSQGLITNRRDSSLHPVAVGLLGLFVVVSCLVLCSVIAQS